MRRVTHWQEKHVLSLMVLTVPCFCHLLYSELGAGNVMQGVLPVIFITNNYSLMEAIKSTESVAERRLTQTGRLKKGASSLVLLKALKDGQ